MDDLGFNKVAGAVLATGLGIMILRALPGLMMHAEYPDTPVYSVGALPVAAETGEEELPFPQETWVAAMDAERGAKVFKKCQSCHNVNAGGKNGTGPALHGVVGRQSGGVAGFNYSAPMKNAGYAWDYENLDGFLTKPAKYMSGTKMSFAGLKKPADRAAVIEYLRQAGSSDYAKPTPAMVEGDNIEEQSNEPTVDPTEIDGDNVAEPATTEE